MAQNLYDRQAIITLSNPPIINSLSLLIVNYNVCHFLAHCLVSAERAAEGLGVEMIVVDNGSSDGSEEFIEERFPAVKWISRPDNPGFAVACNLALAQATGDFVLFLNPDVLLGENTLKNALAILQENHQGLLGLRMLDGAGQFLPESKRALPTPAASFWKMTGFSTWFPKSAVFNQYALGHLPEDAQAAVPVLAGAFLLGRRSLLEALNGFDEAFWMYGEDIDLSYRATLHTGQPNVYAGQLPIIHFKGESTHKQGRRYVKAFYEAMHLFVKKHYASKGSWWLRAGLHTAIGLGGLLRTLKPPATPRTTEPEHYWAIGDVDECRRLFPELSHTLTDIASLPSLPKGSAVLWCIGGLLHYEHAIAFLASHPWLGLRYFWFHPKAGSIIGSDGKEGLGWWRRAV